jgi:sporulation protein YlmC with PRC-barrel domain
MRLTDLQNKDVRTEDGERLGRVHEVHCQNGVVIALKVGPGSFIERLTVKTKGRRVPWDRVRKIEEKRIVVTPDPPQRSSR